MLPKSIVLGYHGCRRALARQVAADKQALKPSRNENDWLGNTIYFFADDPKRAFDWACKRAAECGESTTDYAVLGAAIDSGNCLHLAESTSFDYLRAAYGHLKQFCELQNRPLPRNTGALFNNRKLDCAVFEAVHVLRENERLTPFDTVVAYLTEGREIYPGAAVRALDHIQICVRNEAKILGWFLPR